MRLDAVPPGEPAAATQNAGALVPEPAAAPPKRRGRPPRDISKQVAMQVGRSHCLLLHATSVVPQVVSAHYTLSLLHPSKRPSRWPTLTCICRCTVRSRRWSDSETSWCGRTPSTEGCSYRCGVLEQSRSWCSNLANNRNSYITTVLNTCLLCRCKRSAGKSCGCNG